MIPLHAVQLELAAGRLVILDVVGLPIQRTWFVVQREGKRLSHAAQAFREFLLAEGAAHAALPAVAAGEPAAGRRTAAP
jgi:DNA-binding transcriptional LysR family regulator